MNSYYTAPVVPDYMVKTEQESAAEHIISLLEQYNTQAITYTIPRYNIHGHTMTFKKQENGRTALQNVEMWVADPFKITKFTNLYVKLGETYYIMNPLCTDKWIPKKNKSNIHIDTIIYDANTQYLTISCGH